MNFDIETMVKECPSCSSNQTMPPKAEPVPWPEATKSWQRIHIDYCGPFFGKTFLVVIDAYSKWPEIVLMNGTDTTKTIQALREMFWRYGLPEILVSDNGTQFKNLKFEEFTRANGIRHIFTPPYHPASNGQVERYNSTFKRFIKKLAQNGQVTEWNLKVKEFLFTYRSTPHTVIKCTPASRFLGRELRSALDFSETAQAAC